MLGIPELAVDDALEVPIWNECRWRENAENFFSSCEEKKFCSVLFM